MNININEYKKFRIYKLKQIKENISKCQNLATQIGGDISEKDIDDKYEEIKGKINRINSTLNLLEDSNKDLTLIINDQNKDITKVNTEIANLKNFVAF